MQPLPQRQSVCVGTQSSFRDSAILSYFPGAKAPGYYRSPLRAQLVRCLFHYFAQNPILTQTH